MTGLMLDRRALLQAGGAMMIGLGAAGGAGAQTAAGIAAPIGKPLDPTELDGFFAVHADGSVTLFSGKVDLGTGLRVAYRQIVAEELGVAMDRIALVEGDTGLTPNQGPTAGSTGIMVGGVQIRQAAATARAALIGLGAERLGQPAANLETAEGMVRPRNGGSGIGFGALVGDKRFSLKIDAKAALKDPDSYTLVGKPLPRPDVPAKLSGRHVYVHDFRVPGMLHARVIRPPAIGAKLLDVDAASIASIPGARVVRLQDFVAVVAEDEWDAVRARTALKLRWAESATLIGHAAVSDWLRAGPFDGEQSIVNKGDAVAALAAAPSKISGTFYWPVQSHASMGPSCAVADVRDGAATVWTASQGTHRFVPAFARILDLPVEKVRLIYLDGAGCYGMNGHDDAAADAALISKALGRPVRVQWSREDEHGWDPKGPPQLLAIEAALGADGRIGAWRTQMWIPKATANLPNVPLVGPQAAGIAQVAGISTGLITQNGDPPYATPNVEVRINWLKDAPLRPSNIRAPGKIANSFAVESITDELAYAARKDPLEFRLEGLGNPRGVEVLKRAGALMAWQSRATPRLDGIGRGISYVHYKHNETFVAIGMEVEVDRSSGELRVRRIVCAHDCGQVINPDATRAQVEGNILQTLSRTLFEEVAFDRERVTSVEWSSYPILTFPDVPDLAIELIDRPRERPLGAGEAATAPVPAALANAIFDATGARMRIVPFTPARVKAAIALGRA